MRKTAVALAFAFVALLSSRAHAADKLHLERMDTHQMPTLRFYLTLVDRDGRVASGKQKEDFRLSIDSAEQGAATSLIGFDETKEPINVVVVAEVGSAMSGVIEDEKRAIAALADALPAKSKIALIGYAGDTKRLTDTLTVAADVESQAKQMTIDSDSGAEMHMLDALATAMDLLAAAPKGERKLIVLFSDGINADMDQRIFLSKGKRAAESDIIIDTIGFNEFDPSKTRNLGVLAKQSNGNERLCKGASDIGNHFNNVIDEIKKQYVATFEVALAGGDNKKHDFQVITGGDSGGAYSNTLTRPLPIRGHDPKLPDAHPTRWWLWLLIGLGAVGVIGLIAWLVFREKPEPMEVAAPEPQKPVAPQPQQPMKTMALDMSASSGAVAVGWIVATSGKYADQTFKLKPARTLIGTGADCDVKVEDQFMSSHHCEVRFQGGSFKLFDLGSTNGIVVNDKKVNEHELVDNDQFRLGRTEFKFKSIT
jgi:hypothetical protein